MQFELDISTIIIVCIVYLAGFVAAFYALFQSRTSQGAAAWVLGLIAFPFISLPIFIAFGKRKIKLYSRLKIASYVPLEHKELSRHFISESDVSIENFLSKSEHPFVGGNQVKLLKDGSEVFSDMLEAIERADSFILLQMYIFRSDDLGRKFAELLALKARQGLKVYILYENFVLSMSQEVLDLWKRSGVHFGKYDPGKRSKFHLNFRNHRKLLLIDGKIAYFGGVNIGDDYLGLYPDLGFWRDTNIRVKGPGVIFAQLAFAKDWFWAKSELIKVSWNIPDTMGKSSVLVLNSDPGEERPMNLLQHVEMINSAKSRIWIANPYLVPPQGLIDALYIAKIRGVDIRILVPSEGDNGMVSCAAEVYYERLVRCGIKIFKYTKGMMHQKVILIDDILAVIGSSNLDFRSLYINFENSVAVNDETILSEVENMLRDDFADAFRITTHDLRRRSMARKFRSHVSNVLAPIL